MVMSKLSVAGDLADSNGRSKMDMREGVMGWRF